VTVDVEPGADETVADDRSFEEVLSRVTENALKFTPAGSPLRLEVRRRGDEALVVVADRGPGIPEADRERVFHAFEQGDDGPTRPHGGLGAGLYISRRLVEAHGGRMWIDETPGGGTTVLFSIPQPRSSDSPVVEDADVSVVRR
jgi:signal transduction histidine kinase